MKKIMGIDISSKSTGWAVIQGDKLLEFGKINPTGTMSAAQKLFYFHVELERIIAKQQPEEIAVEDVVQVKSVSVVKILARFNGVAVVESYRYLQRDPMMFEPTQWKKLVKGCTGGSKKCDVQLSVCEMYNLLPKDKIEFYRNKINDIRNQLGENNDAKKISLKDLNKQLKKYKYKESSDGLSIEDRQKKVNDLRRQIDAVKSQNDSSRKKNKKEASKLFDDISMQIYTESSINEDIADAVGVAIAFQKTQGV